MGIIEAFVLMFAMGNITMYGTLWYTDGLRADNNGTRIIYIDKVVPKEILKTVKVPSGQCDYAVYNISVKNGKDATKVIIGAVGDSVARVKTLNKLEKRLKEKEKRILKERKLLEKREKLLELKKQVEDEE